MLQEMRRDQSKAAFPYAHRKIASVPRKQQELLDAKDSWAVDHSARPHGLVNVPESVLVAATEAYLSQSNSRGGEDRRSSQASPPSRRVPEAVMRPQSEHVASSPAALPSSPVSWPASPERGLSHEQAKTPPKPSPTRNNVPPSTEAASPPRTAASGSTPHASAPAATPACTLPMPLYRQAAQIPPSSYEQPDLEMQLPQAHVETRPHSPVPRGSPPSTKPVTSGVPSSLQTPPCAQPPLQTIPMTADTDLGTTAGRPQTRKPKFKHLPALFSDDVPSATLAQTHVPSARRETRLHNKPLQLIDYSGLSSISSTIPQTQAQPAPMATFHHPRMTYVSVETQTGEDGPVHIPEDELADVYGVYCEVYPAYATAYKGNLGDFARACLSLEVLQKERALTEFLFDDFIRAFSSGYLKHVRDRSKPGGPEALPAVEWYNLVTKKPLFLRSVVNGHNLSTILRSYPQEVARGRKTVRAERATTEAMSSIEPVSRRESLVQEERPPATSPAAPREPIRETVQPGPHASIEGKASEMMSEKTSEKVVAPPPVSSSPAPTISATVPALPPPSSFYFRKPALSNRVPSREESEADAKRRRRMRKLMERRSGTAEVASSRRSSAAPPSSGG